MMDEWYERERLYGMTQEEEKYFRDKDKIFEKYTHYKFKSFKLREIHYMKGKQMYRIRRQEVLDYAGRKVLKCTIYQKMPILPLYFPTEFEYQEDVTSSSGYDPLKAVIEKLQELNGELSKRKQKCKFKDEWISNEEIFSEAL